MRAYSTAFNEKNNDLRKEPRWVVALSFDIANTDIYYFTSHADCEVPPGTADANIIYSVLKNPIVNSQKLDPRTVKFSIGSLTFELIDKNSVVGDLLKTKLDAGSGIRHKRVRIYKGYAGLLWADYQIPPGGTQIIDDKLSFNRGTYLFRCNDIQRTAQKNVFDVKKTNLTSAYTAGDTTINVVSTTDFEMVAHGTSFTDAPSATVGYIRNGDNVIRYTGKTATTFTGCVGGRFNTKDIDIDVDSGATNDRQPTIEEFIYLEMPAAKMAKTILMGTNPTVPEHWHLGIPATYVSTSQFDGIGNDLYNPADDTAGLVLRFDGLKKRDGKKFIQEQINLPAGCFMPVQSDGQLGYKRMTGVVSGASPVAVLDASNVISYTSLDHDTAAVSNRYAINWNKIVAKDKPTRRNTYIDSTSITPHQKTKPYELTFEGIHGARYTDAFIRDTFNVLRDRYSGPPMLITVELFQSLSGIEVGDAVWCDFNQRDFVGGGDLNRAFEVVGYRDDGNKITLNLFGSSQKAGALVASSATTVMADSFYSSGLTAGNKLDVATTGSLTGAVWHITADSTLTGGADMGTDANVFWYPGDVTIDSGVTLTLVDNVQIRVMGTFTNNGTIDLSGNGLAGAASAETLGTSGYVGNTASGSGWRARNSHGGSTYIGVFGNHVSGYVAGKNNAIPVLNIQNDGSNLTGITGDFRSSSGSGGANVIQQLGNKSILATGGAGRNGGAACVLISRGYASGGSGLINLDGTKGQAGGYVKLPAHYSGDPDRGVYAGAGGGGYPAVFYALMDGLTSNVPSSSDFSASRPSPDFLGSQSSKRNNVYFSDSSEGWPIYNGYQGLYSFESVSAVTRTQYIPPSETAAEDVEELTDPPTAITIQEATATNNSMNLVALEISVTAPAATNYRGSMIYIKKNSTNSWQQVGEARAAEEVIFYVPADGSTYNIKAHPVSIKGVESPEFYGPVSKTIGTIQTAVIGTNNTLATATNVAATGGVRINENGIDLYDSSGNKIFDANSNNGELIVGIVADDKYFKFDPVSGTLTLGKDTEIKGVPSYGNDSYTFSGKYGEYISFTDKISVSGSAYIDRYNGNLRLGHGATGGTAIFLGIQGPSFDKMPIFSNSGRWRLKCHRMTIEIGSVIFMSDGIIKSSSVGGLGFTVTRSGTIVTIKGMTRLGSNVTYTAGTTIPSAGNSVFEIEVVFTSGVNAEFFYDGVSMGVITTNLPSRVNGFVEIELQGINNGNSQWIEVDDFKSNVGY